MDLSTLPPVALQCGVEAGKDSKAAAHRDDWPATRTPRAQFISGLTLLGAGSAALLTGYVLLGPRARKAEDWVGALDAGGQGSVSFQQKWLNMGIGMTVIVRPAFVDSVSQQLTKMGETVYTIGRITSGARGVELR